MEASKVIKLYGGYPFRSTRPLWLLEELEVEYEQIKVAIHPSSEGLYVRSEEYKKINPNACVPTLIDGNNILYESGAICMALADKYSDKALSPPINDYNLRSQYYVWISYTIATIDEPVITYYFEKTHKKEGEQNQMIMDKCLNKIDVIKEVLQSKALANGDKSYVLGDTFSAADVVLGYSVWFMNFMGLIDNESDDDKVLKNYLARLQEREAFKRTFKRK